MQKWIRKWLGITELNARISDLTQGQMRICERDRKLQGEHAKAMMGLGRVIAKIDPAYGKELTYEARVASDLIGRQVMDRLASEHDLGNRYR